MDKQEGLYSKAHDAFMDKIYPAMNGVRMTTQDMWSLVGIQNKPEHAIHKKALNDLLYNLAHVNRDRLLSQEGKYYRRVIKDTKELKWWVDSGKEVVDFRWMKGHDGTSFGFEDSIVINPGDGIHFTGEGNRGKTTAALSLMVENVDNTAFEGITYFTTEFNDFKFKNRIARFDWVDLWDKEKDRPKFEVLPAVPHYEDEIAVRPNNLIIIDWIKMEDKAWQMRERIEKMLKPLDRGVLVVLSQKRTTKQYGEGGEGGMDLISAGFHIMHERLWVEKVKEYASYNPEKKMFGFEIVGGGSKFQYIREIDKCPTCKGYGTIRSEECGTCFGKKWIDK